MVIPKERSMAASKIAITIEKTTLTRLDRLVRECVFPNRSKAIRQALEEKISNLEKNKLGVECEKLDPKEEMRLAEEGFALKKNQWPEY
jgi:Arc/MetJ-type ribon-helix-helix transcriptional regulator